MLWPGPAQYLLCRLSQSSEQLHSHVIHCQPLQGSIYDQCRLKQAVPLTCKAVHLILLDLQGTGLKGACPSHEKCTCSHTLQCVSLCLQGQVLVSGVERPAE